MSEKKLDAKELETMSGGWEYWDLTDEEKQQYDDAYEELYDAEEYHKASKIRDAQKKLDDLNALFSEKYGPDD